MHREQRRLMARMIQAGMVSQVFNVSVSEPAERVIGAAVIDRLARREELAFLGLPPFVVVRDWMGRPVRLVSV